MPTGHTLERAANYTILSINSSDGTNRLHLEFVASLNQAITALSFEPQPLIITGNAKFFSVGADLKEIHALTGPTAYEFACTGQRLMQTIAKFSAPVVAAIHGHCMGGGLDLALACHHRIAAPNAIFGHRGSALGLMTGWGGTQRLPQIIGKARALQMFVAAEKLAASDALRICLVNEIADEPVVAAVQWLSNLKPQL